MGIFHLFAAGGVVMFPLLVFSVAAMLRKERSKRKAQATPTTIALIIERVRFWYRINQRQKRVVQEFFKLYRLNNIVGILDKLQQNIDLPIARIFLSGLKLKKRQVPGAKLAIGAANR